MDANLCRYFIACLLLDCIAIRRRELGKGDGWVPINLSQARLPTAYVAVFFHVQLGKMRGDCSYC